MKVEALDIPEVKLVTPTRFADSRGHFSETWQATRYEAAGIAGPFVQDNQSFSTVRGTVRGLHLQVGDNAQGKLVRVLRGRIWDVAVDVRHGSPTFGRHAAGELDAEAGLQLWIPAGFLHGFVTLTDAAEVFYKVTAPYDRAAERGVRWDDPSLALPWPLDGADAVLSDKDAVLPLLRDCEPWFHV